MIFPAFWAGLSSWGTFIDWNSVFFFVLGYNILFTWKICISLLWYIFIYTYYYISFFRYLSLLSRSSKNSHLSHLCHWLGTWEFQAVKADLARKRVSTLRKPNQKWQPSVDAMLAASRPATIQIAWLAMCIYTYISYRSSMYGISAYIYHRNQPQNVAKCSSIPWILCVYTF